MVMSSADLLLHAAEPILVHVALKTRPARFKAELDRQTGLSFFGLPFSGDALISGFKRKEHPCSEGPPIQNYIGGYMKGTKQGYLQGHCYHGVKTRVAIEGLARARTNIP